MSIYYRAKRTITTGIKILLASYIAYQMADSCNHYAYGKEMINYENNRPAVRLEVREVDKPPL